MLLLASGLGHGGCMDFLYSAFRLMYQFQQRMKAWLEYIILHVPSPSSWPWFSEHRAALNK
jgi:hypothetical protein